MGGDGTDPMRLPLEDVTVIEHTEEVLRELLGMSPEAVAALREQGVIGGPSTR
jgi:crotonobetainyl-CoA:carnitine CoA-transferase CaiB-like acyl-CoA transferase